MCIGICRDVGVSVPSNYHGGPKGALQLEVSAQKGPMCVWKLPLAEGKIQGSLGPEQ